MRPCRKGENRLTINLLLRPANVSRIYLLLIKSNSIAKLLVASLAVTMEENMGTINYDFIEEFIRQFIPQRDGLILEIERSAKEKGIPIVEPEVGRLIYLLARIKKCKAILEIGTAIGYSTMILAGGLEPGGRLITIEKDKEMADEAEKNFERLGLSNVILLKGDALEILKNMVSTGNYQFDFIFLDAAKGQYVQFLPLCYRLLNTGGLLVADNVLYKGMVANRDLLKRRKITIVKRLKKYLNQVTSHPNLETSILPIGDGVSISLKV